MASKPKWLDVTDLPDRKIEDHICNVVAYLKTLDNPNIKLIATECGAPYPRVYHCYHGRTSRYERDGPNRQLTKAKEVALCRIFNLLDNISLSPRLSLIARSANDLLAQSPTGITSPPTVREIWPIQF
jgi:hypothetical protein